MLRFDLKDRAQKALLAAGLLALGTGAGVEMAAWLNSHALGPNMPGVQRSRLLTRVRKGENAEPLTFDEFIGMLARHEDQPLARAFAKQFLAQPELAKAYEELRQTRDVAAFTGKLQKSKGFQSLASNSSFAPLAASMRNDPTAAALMRSVDATAARIASRLGQRPLLTASSGPSAVAVESSGGPLGNGSGSGSESAAGKAATGGAPVTAERPGATGKSGILPMLQGSSLGGGGQGAGATSNAAGSTGSSGSTGSNGGTSETSGTSGTTSDSSTGGGNSTNGGTTSGLGLTTGSGSGSSSGFQMPDLSKALGGLGQGGQGGQGDPSGTATQQSGGNPPDPPLPSNCKETACTDAWKNLKDYAKQKYSKCDVNKSPCNSLFQSGGDAFGKVLGRKSPPLGAPLINQAFHEGAMKIDSLTSN